MPTMCNNTLFHHYILIAAACVKEEPSLIQQRVVSEFLTIMFGFSVLSLEVWLVDDPMSCIALTPNARPTLYNCSKAASFFSRYFSPLFLANYCYMQCCHLFPIRRNELEFAFSTIDGKLRYRLCTCRSRSQFLFPPFFFLL